MRVIVTCGPSYEPIDEVRRLTNFSTGELGVRLACQLAQAGHDVICFQGLSATWPAPTSTPHLQTLRFTTNDDLLAQLRAVPSPETVAAVFHTAALCDYRVASITSGDSEPVTGAKIPSRSGPLHLTLQPATKLLGELGPLFACSRVIGWKYELEGAREEAEAKAYAQLTQNRSAACVLNGKAYGPGFGWYAPGQPPIHCADKPALCRHIAHWL